jgi:hypothetical protein
VTVPVQTITYRREQLYAEVWSEPATAVAKRYGISSVALGKICDRLNVPAPPRGYWRRRAVGTIDPTPPLPPQRFKATPEITVTRKGRRPDRSLIADSLSDGRAAMGPPIIVPDRLGQPHPLVSTALSVLGSAKLQNGLTSCGEERCLDIAVSPSLLPRACRIMNALILALEERGLPVEVTEVLAEDEPDRDARSNVTRVLVGGEWIRFGFVERLRQHRCASDAKPPRGLKGQELELWLYWNRPRMRLIPSGRLLLTIKEPEVGVQVSWADRLTRLEDRLNDFVKQLFVVAEAKKQRHHADRSWRATYEVEAQRNREERARAEEEARRVTVVRTALARWREARELRQLIQEVRFTDSDCGHPEWLEWAEAYATKIERELQGASPKPS